jgi:hypothetical protein
MSGLRAVAALPEMILHRHAKPSQANGRVTSGCTERDYVASQSVSLATAP